MMKNRLIISAYLGMMLCSGSIATAQTCIVTTVTPTPPNPPVCYTCSGMASFTVPASTTWEVLSASTILNATDTSGYPYVDARDAVGNVVFGLQVMLLPTIGTYRLTFAPGLPQSVAVSPWMTAPLPIGFTIGAGHQFQIGMTGTGAWHTDNGAELLVRSCGP